MSVLFGRAKRALATSNLEELRALKIQGLDINAADPSDEVPCASDALCVHVHLRVRSRCAGVEAMAADAHALRR